MAVLRGLSGSDYHYNPKVVKPESRVLNHLPAMAPSPRITAIIQVLNVASPVQVVKHMQEPDWYFSFPKVSVSGSFTQMSSDMRGQFLGRGQQKGSAVHSGVVLRALFEIGVESVIRILMFAPGQFGWIPSNSGIRSTGGIVRSHFYRFIR